MKTLLLLLLLLTLRGVGALAQPLSTPPAPNYDRNLFGQSLAFHNTSRNVFFEDFNTVFETELDGNFTMECWVKISASIPPGTLVLRTNHFDLNFGSRDDGGTLHPSLIFLVKSFDGTGGEFPDTDYYYHLVGQDLPYFNDWFHVAIVRNRNTSEIRMYINGISDYAGHGPSGALLPLEDQGISLGGSFTSYMKIDELRIWKEARSEANVHMFMNEPINRQSANLMAYYNFDHSTYPDHYFDENETRMFANISRGIGSPATDENLEEHPLAGQIFGDIFQGPAPVTGPDIDYSSVASGDWDDPDTWGGEVPREDEIITVFHAVTLDKDRSQAGVIFQTDIASMRTSARVSNDNLVYTNGHTLTLASPPTGGGEYSYIVTDSGGKLLVNNIPYSGAQLPVGSESAYRPVFLAQPAGSQFLSFSVEARDEITPAVPGTASVVDALWDISPLAPSHNPYVVRLQWNQTDERAGFTHNTASVANFHDNKWTPIVSEGVETLNSTTYAITATEVSDFSPFIITSNESSLPVRLTDFRVIQEGTVAQLKWSASDASLFSRFEMERSNDALEWETIGTKLASDQGTALRQYAFSDPLPILNAAKRYYRLKMIDLDETHTHSEIRVLSPSVSTQQLLYPNPANRNSIIHFDLPVDLSKAEIKIFSLSGVPVQQQSSLQDNRINLTGLSTGIYIIKIATEGGEIYREKVLIK